jgi:hypothetical protein
MTATVGEARPIRACGPFVTAAPVLASLGLRVLPVKLRTKTPAIGNWPTVATCDPDQIARWGPRHGAGNVGVATGGWLVVLDLDVKGGAAGLATLAALEREHGQLPATVAVDTPTGGRHIYFRLPAGIRAKCSVSRIGPGVDVRGEGGFVVAPPSVHPNGVAYAWQDGHAPWQVPIASLPDAWGAMLQPAAPGANDDTAAPGVTSRYGARALASEVARVAVAPEGTRNDALNKGAFRIGQLQAAGHVAGATARAGLTSAGVQSGLPASEAGATVQSGLRAGRRHRRPIAPPSTGGVCPALTVAMLDTLRPLQQRGLTLADAGEGHVIVTRNGEVLPGIDVPPIGLDADLVACIGRGVGRLSGVVGHRVLHWEVTTAHSQRVAGADDFRRLAVDGAWSALAEMLGVPSQAAEVREVVLAQAHLRFRFPHGSQGNLLSYDEPIAEARNRRALLVLVLGETLLHGYSAKLPEGTVGHRHRRNRWLVPLLPNLPRLDALPPAYMAEGVQLHWLFLRFLAGAARTLATRHAVPMTAADWHRLAAEAGLPGAYLPRLLASWQDAGLGAAFLAQPEPDLWTLGPEHASAVAMIVRRVSLADEHKRRAGDPRNASPRK